MYEQNAVSGAKSSVDNAYDLTVQDSQFHFQLSILIKGESIRSYTCNCKPFKRDEECSHLVAALFYLRDLPGEVKSTTKKKERSLTQLPPITKMLNQVTEEQAKDVIRLFARKDEVFRLLFYARHINLLGKQQLAAFIDKSFPTIKVHGEKVPAKKLRNFMAVCAELLDQVKDLMSKDDITSAFEITYLLLRKSFYITFNVIGENQKLAENHTELLKYFHEIVESIEAPEFKQVAIERQLSLLDASYINADTRSERRLWTRILETKDFDRQLLKIIDGHKQNTETLSPGTLHFIVMLELLLLDEATLRATIKQKDYQQLYRIIQLLASQVSIRNGGAVLTTILFDYQLNDPLALLILRTLSGSLMTEDLFDKGVDYFVKSGNPEFLNLLKGNSNFWARKKEDVEQRLLEKGDGELLIRFCMAENQMEKALITLKAHLDLKLLVKFDRYFAEDNSEDVFTMYTQLANDYLNDHFGMKSRSYIDRIRDRIRIIGGRKFSDQLERSLKSNYKDRSYLFSY